MSMQTTLRRYLGKEEEVFPFADAPPYSYDRSTDPAAIAASYLPPVSDTWAFLERVAIMEIDGGLDPDAAIAQAGALYGVMAGGMAE